jgi:prophage DNA circulation protein
VYRIPYALPGTAPQGTYTLLVEASYTTNLIEAFGASSSNFLLSPTFTAENAQLINVEDKIGTIMIPDLGIIKANLTAINARLVSVQGTEATLQSDIGTLKTNTETINAKVTSIDGNTATISSDVGTIKNDIRNIRSETATSGLQIEATTLTALMFSLIGAVGALFSVILIKKILPTTPK